MPSRKAGRVGSVLECDEQTTMPAFLAALQGAGVELVPNVPSVRPWVQSASVSVAPISPSLLCQD